MGYNVGAPNEHVQLADGNTVQARDMLGLLLDPVLYVKKKCKQCMGRGILTMWEPISKQRADAIVQANPTHEGLLHQREPGKFALRTTAICGCARQRYTMIFKLFADALVRNKLARWKDFTSEKSESFRRDQLELL